MNNPLVTIHIACYNQEWCIKEALDGAFAQTYSPLEIVIVDDCSTDSTWDIVTTMVDDYRAKDGRHTIITRRNPENAYKATDEIKRIFRKEIRDLWHGELIVQADGDDVSLPNRVEEIVKAWVGTEKRVDLLLSGSRLINKDSEVIGHKSCHSHISGSSMAYTKRMENLFRGFDFSPIHGDEVRYYRAKMLGGVELIDKELVLYRQVGGYSQVHGEFRKPMIHAYKCIINNRKQLLLDVDKLNNNTTNIHPQWRAFFAEDLRIREAELPLWESDSFSERVKAYFSMPFKRRFLTGMLLYGPILLLPRSIGDYVLNFIHHIIGG